MGRVVDRGPQSRQLCENLPQRWFGALFVSDLRLNSAGFQERTKDRVKCWEGFKWLELGWELAQSSPTLRDSQGF